MSQSAIPLAQLGNRGGQPVGFSGDVGAFLRQGFATIHHCAGPLGGFPRPRPPFLRFGVGGGHAFAVGGQRAVGQRLIRLKLSDRRPRPFTLLQQRCHQRAGLCAIGRDGAGRLCPVMFDPGSVQVGLSVAKPFFNGLAASRQTFQRGRRFIACAQSGA